MTDDRRDRIVAMRRDGYSSGHIEVELGVNRMVVGIILRQAGIADSPGRPDERYPLRCAKCGEFGHSPTGCEKGDALDQLDAAEGFTPRMEGKLTRDQYAKLKEAHYKYDVPASTLRINYPRMTVEAIELALRTQNYEEYLNI